MVSSCVPFGLYSGDCLGNVMALFIPGFVSANVQFKLIVRDKFLSLQMLFISLFFSSFPFYKSVSLCLYGRVHVCIYIYIYFRGFRFFFDYS